MSDVPPTATGGALSIRLLEPEEVEVVGALLGLARLHQGDGRYLVAWDGGTPLGHVHLALTDPPELQDLEVRSDRRGRGVATALVAALEDEARRQGADEVRLDVSTGEPGVRRLYERLGYRDAGLPARRVQGRITIRTGTIDVDDELLTLSKRLPQG